MADNFYDVFRGNMWGKDDHTYVDLEDATVGVFFVDEADDTIDLAADQDVADRAAASQVPAFPSAPNLTTPTVTLTSNRVVYDSDPVTFTALSGDEVESFDFFKDTGTDTTSVLIANMDSATGLPLTPSGGDVTITAEDAALAEDVRRRHGVELSTVGALGVSASSESAATPASTGTSGTSTSTRR